MTVVVVILSEAKNLTGRNEMMDSAIMDGRKYFKFCPYAKYDTESMERWLNERAAEGFVLSRRGFFGPFAIFFKGTKPMRYQILTESFDAKIYSDMVDTMEENGWHHVIEEESSRINVFVSDDPEAIDLHTDPEIERIERNKGGARMSGRYFGNFIILPIAYFIFYFVLNNIFKNQEYSMLNLRMVLVMAIFIATLYFPIGFSAVGRLRLDNLRRERGIQLSDKEYKRRAVVRTMMWIVLPVLYVVELVLVVNLI